MENFSGNKEINLKKIKNTILVMSGKGGVGKSTVTVNIARALHREGLKVGVLDIDIHGPSVPKMLDIENMKFEQSHDGFIVPVKASENFYAASIAMMMDGDGSPVIWRGPMKSNFIMQMLDSFEWPELDYLVVDCPPGTGDEHLTIIQTIGKVTGAIMVTTPQEVACIDVKKAINFLKQMSVDIIGIVENMAYYECPECKTRVEIFKTGGLKKMAAEFKIPVLGSLPIEPEVGESGETGKSLFDFGANLKTSAVFMDIAKKILSGAYSYCNKKAAVKKV